MAVTHRSRCLGFRFGIEGLLSVFWGGAREVVVELRSGLRWGETGSGVLGFFLFRSIDPLFCSGVFTRPSET